MSSTPPRRLREIRASEQEARRAGRRPFYIMAIALLTVVVGFLTYGFLRQTVFRPRVDATIERTDLYVKAGENIQINVVNACGVDGVARKFTEFLRARNFDVAETMTAKGRQRNSKVIDNVGDPISAQKVAYALGIPAEEVETAIDSSLYLRATVVIGEDYQSLRPMK